MYCHHDLTVPRLHVTFRVKDLLPLAQHEPAVRNGYAQRRSYEESDYTRSRSVIRVLSCAHPAGILGILHQILVDLRQKPGLGQPHEGFGKRLLGSAV